MGVAFDVSGAMKAGYSPSEIARHLAEISNMDYDGATQAGYSDQEIIDHAIGAQHHYTPQEIQTAAARERATPGSMSNPSQATGSFTQNATDAAGKVSSDLIRGGAQILGLGDAASNALTGETIAESKARDAALMKSRGATTGAIIGGALPAALVGMAAPALASTYAGAAGIGAGLGALSPQVGSMADIIKGKAASAAEGAVGGLLGMGAGRLIGSGLGALKGLLWDPFTTRGQQYIASTLAREHAVDPAALAQQLRNASSPIPGYAPTVAEVVGDTQPGIAQLQRTAHGLDPSKALDAADVSNVNALADSLRKIAGTPNDMAIARNIRKGVSAPAYAAMDAAHVSPDSELLSLLGRPSVQGAWQRANNLGLEKDGLTIPLEMAGNADVPGRFLQRLKMGMDDMASGNPATGIAGNELNALRDTRGQLVDWIEGKVPQYAVANNLYRDFSRPIDQMNVGQELYDKMVPALNDFRSPDLVANVRANAYADALRNAERTVQNATDVPNGRTLEQVMRPDQMDTLNNVGKALAMRATAQNAGKASGSPTADNLASQNLVRQIAGPLGIPQGLWNGPWMPTLSRVPEWILSQQEPSIGRQLAQLLANPSLMADALQNAAVPTAPAAIGNALGRYAAPAAALSLGNASQQ